MNNPKKNLRARVLSHWLVSLVVLAVSLQAQADPMDQARKCTSEPRRLERLACFDEVFATPLAEPAKTPGLPGRQPSERWRLAYRQAATQVAPATGAPGNARYRSTGQTAGLLVTVPALGAQPPRPLLALQCHNNITELTLMLPEPLDTEQVSLALGASDSTRQRAWRVRDNGYVLSVGRGLPAIRVVKSMAAQTDVRVYSQHSRIDGLLFDLNGFHTAIRPIRETCGW